MTTKVQSEFIADSSVTTAKLADDAVTTAKLGNITTISSSGDITLDATGDIILDADGDDIKIAEGGTVVMEIKHENTGVNFHLNTTDEDYKFRGSDGGSTITALQLDMSDAGTAIFNNTIKVSPDSDVVAEIGRAHVGGGLSGLSDYAIFSHLHAADSGGYALAQNASGATFLNADDGQDIKFLAHGTTKMTMASDGKFGIGTTSPDDRLDIMGGGYDQIRIGSNKTDNTNKTAGIVSTMYTNNTVSFFQGYFQNGDNSVYYGSADSGHRGIQNHYFYVNTNYNATSGHALAYQISAAGGHKHKFLTSANSNSTKVQIHNGEGLWVYNNGGSSYSSYGLGSALRVTELSTNQSATHYIEISGNLPGYSNGQYNCLKTDLNDLHFAAGNTYTGYISYNTGFNDISDLREKENITTITNATDKLKQLRGVYHTWKDTANRGSDTQMGLIAQEVEAVVPEVVTTSSPTSLQTGEEDTDGLKGVSYGKLVPLLIETIKELEARIKILEG